VCSLVDHSSIRGRMDYGMVSEENNLYNHRHEFPMQCVQIPFRHCVCARCMSNEIFCTCLAEIVLHC
jgi:hypothetical protein